MPGVGPTAGLQEHAGLTFNLQKSDDEIRAGREYRLILDVRNAAGEPAPLEELMGALGHMVAFDYAGTGFAHMHPVASVVGPLAERSAHDLEFVFSVDQPGRYRLWAQVQYGGEEIYAPFDVDVR